MLVVTWFLCKENHNTADISSLHLYSFQTNIMSEDVVPQCCHSNMVEWTYSQWGQKQSAVSAVKSLKQLLIQLFFYWLVTVLSLTHAKQSLGVWGICFQSLDIQIVGFHKFIINCIRCWNSISKNRGYTVVKMFQIVLYSQLLKTLNPQQHKLFSIPIRILWKTKSLDK